MSDLHREIMVCYDVECNKRRSKLFDALKDIGLRPIQKSVFWGDVTVAERKAIQREFLRLLDPKMDFALVVDVHLRDTATRNAFGYSAADFPPMTDHHVL